LPDLGEPVRLDHVRRAIGFPPVALIHAKTGGSVMDKFFEVMEGPFGRLLRVVLGVVLIYLGLIRMSGTGGRVLFGIAVLNLVLVSFCLHLQEQGTAPRQAIAKAAELRLRPVLMTALVAALGFVPMALSRSPGSEVQRPLATVVIGGLVTATALTLLRFPAVYARAHRGRAEQAVDE